MKKILFAVIAILVFSVSSRAQWGFGGGFSLSVGSNEKLSVYVAPEVSYYFTNHFSLGTRLSYYSGNNSFGVDPYLRWNFLKPESVVRILATFHSPMSFTKDYFSYGVYFQPGISFRVGSNVRLECHIGTFGWGGTKSGEYNSAGWLFNISASTTSVGVVFTL